ncbi:Uncharacterised protein [Clostridium putrefaciens]|uniref:Uncharacterized protein n=1 Tax=Clostridium putrefaciens TaxID=99675 RepID=A0A381J3V5_9CLOT|nr:hypothetical protein [Clostridium putrefaciens]SUY45401.1 Uncharacterised protein [Clostridium putrefaciens]
MNYIKAVIYINKKMIAVIIIAAIATTGGLQPIKTSAIENNSVIKEQTQMSKIIEVEEGKVYDINEVIKIIENKYLEQNEDGTLKIKKTASDEVGKESLDLIYEQIDFVNKKITNKELEFKFTNTADGVKVETTKEDVAIRNARAIGSNIFNHDRCTFSWYWWGFYANVDQTGSAKLRNEYTYLGVQYGVAYGILALIPGGKIPAAVGGGITAISIGDSIRICSNGALDNGVSVGALGAPSSPRIFHLSEM